MYVRMPTSQRMRFQTDDNRYEWCKLCCIEGAELRQIGSSWSRLVPFKLEHHWEGIFFLTEAPGQPTVFYHSHLEMEILCLTSFQSRENLKPIEIRTLSTSHWNLAFRLVWMTRPMPSMTTKSTWLDIMASARDRVILLSSKIRTNQMESYCNKRKCVFTHFIDRLITNNKRKNPKVWIRSRLRLFCRLNFPIVIVHVTDPPLLLPKIETRARLTGVHHPKAAFFECAAQVFVDQRRLFHQKHQLAISDVVEGRLRIGAQDYLNRDQTPKNI